MIRAGIVLALAAVALSQPVQQVQGVGELGETKAEPKFNPDDVFFYLWTRQNPNSYQSIRPGSTSGSSFSNSRRTKVIAHGWNQNGLSDFVIDMKNAFLDEGDYNVISIDWGVDAASIDYFTSAFAVVNVGELAATLVNELVGNGANIKDFHIIGFSLGAHVAGATGAAVSGSVSRVTGLDPAYPSFSLDNPDRRLDTSDGDFVDVIHTNTGTLTEGGLSFPDAIGHVDFFPNGGHEQPGCLDNVSDIIDMISGCSHGRAPKYFIESILSSAFRAKACSSYDQYLSGACDFNGNAVMGYGVSVFERGTYYLQTNADPPYAQG